VKDQVFTGSDVGDAVAAAGRALGLGPEALRYVVLDRGTPGRMGLSGTPAQIAVLLEASGPRPAPRAAPPSPAQLPARAQDPGAAAAAILRAVAEAAGVELAVAVEEDAERVQLRLDGPGTTFLLADAAQVLEALEHLLQRMFGSQDRPRRLNLACAGYREARELALQELARELAGGVRTDGQPRATDPLNAYERWVVHATINQESGLRSFSTGEGAGRRVTVALAETKPNPEA
jgi:spoIIIJ-associated protein